MSAILPLAEPAVRHHLKTLGGSMKEWAQTKTIPPVLLFSGLAGIGKRSMSYFLAQWIFCEKVGFSTEKQSTLDGSGKETPLQPCGTCVQCQRALSNHWVDFTEITSDNQDEPTTGSLKVDQFRRLKETAGFGAHEGSHRIVLIPNADRMTNQAANSMLKILEKPPHGWIFLLTANDPTLILPTVLSRCQGLKLKPMDSGTIEKLLLEGGVLGEKQKVSAALSEGSWGRALALASDDVLKTRQMLFEFLGRPQGVLNNLVDWAAQSPEQLGLLLDQLEMLCLDLVKWSISESPYDWLNADGSMALQNHAQAISRQLSSPDAARNFWIARSERIAQARREALAPLNRKLLLQDVLIPWLKVSD